MRIPSFSALLLLTLLAAGTARAVDPQPDPHAEARAIIGDVQRIVAPSSVQEQHKVRIGGIDQWISVRGADRENPVLLYLHGGPAAPMMPAAWTFQRPWEDYFTVVQWDQRAAGRTYRANDPDSVAPTITIDRYMTDAIELIDWLRDTYGKRKVVLVGHSWGTVIGMRVLLERPDLLHAYVGIGQSLHPQADEAVGYRYALAPKATATRSPSSKRWRPTPAPTCATAASTPNANGSSTTAATAPGARTPTTTSAPSACRRTTTPKTAARSPPAAH